MKFSIFNFCLLFGFQFALAHGNHPPKVATCSDKICTKQEVEAAVPSAVEKLAQSGKIEKTWTSARIEKVEEKQFKKGPEWVATLVDEKQKDPAQQRLYVFITPKGYLSGANKTGQ